LNVLSDADANLVVSHGRESEYRPKWSGTGCTDLKNCKYSNLPSKFTDMIEFTPADAG